jgi:hypothetical protein
MALSLLDFISQNKDNTNNLKISFFLTKSAPDYFFLKKVPRAWASWPLRPKTGPPPWAPKGLAFT